MKRLMIPLAISFLIAASAEAQGINDSHTGYGAYGQSAPSPTSTLNPQGSYGQLLQQAVQSGVQGFSGTGMTGSGTGTGIGLDAGTGSGSAFGTSMGTAGGFGGTSIGTGSFSGSGLGTTTGTGSFGGLGTTTGTGSFGGLGTTTGTGSFGGLGTTTGTGSFGGLGTTTGTGSFGGLGTTTGTGSFGGLDAGGTNFGSAGSLGGTGNTGGIDSGINTALPSGIGPAPGAPDATAGDTTAPDTTSSEPNPSTSPFAKPPTDSDESAPSAPPLESKADTPLRRALSALRLGKYDLCLTLLNQILQANPHNSHAHYLKAVCFVMTRHYAQAGDEYRQCLQLNPTPDMAKLARDGLVKLNH